MIGILADANVQGHIEHLAKLMQSEPWSDFWHALELRLVRFDEIGLSPSAPDDEVWHRCQVDRLILITDNRNEDSPQSLEATIRRCNTTTSLPVFTISDIDRFRSSPGFAKEVIESLFDYLLRLDEILCAGRFYLP